jgi:hypothetical protein
LILVVFDCGVEPRKRQPPSESTYDPGNDDLYPQRFPYFLLDIYLKVLSSEMDQAENVPSSFKGTVPRDFRLQVFFMDQFPPSLRISRKGNFDFFKHVQGYSQLKVHHKRKKSSIRKVFIFFVCTPLSSSLPPVSLTLVANLAPVIVDIGGAP